VGVLAAHPDAAETFTCMSASNTEGRAMPIVEAYDFSAVTTVIDLGGGRGGLMAAILMKHPHVTGVLTDLPASWQRPKRSSTPKAWEHAVKYVRMTSWRRSPREGTAT
jgi:O-methyltransferase domain